MKEHQKRMLVERDRDEDDLAKLDAFISHIPSGITLSPEEYTDMVLQSDAMATKLRRLNRRIARF